MQWKLIAGRCTRREGGEIERRIKMECKIKRITIRNELQAWLSRKSKEKICTRDREGR